MNDSASKVPIYIAIIVALLIVAAGGYYLTSGGGSASDNSGKVTPETHETPADTQKDIKAAESTKEVKASAPTPAPVAEKKVETIKCELCHTEPQKINQHLNGGKLCINCHGSQVHNIHIGQGTIGLNCDTCHGFPPTIPTVEKGEGPGHYTVCEKCHAAPPNSLKPSNGDLIIVHLSRGKYCTNCHGTDIGTIHMAALGKTK
ncbi:MAG: hypothetical protein OIN89_00140 [Candidatus Methanoperedens sp.]|jgi:hypothetical protein|nr:hypothetical protein [Candidatus Methanoperedens sp.]PKL54766.1 MAG: hypothetical protein CVV36_00135 [Candidatus Methanoperedenaceae archaeon HGW-Methanoperedenaceae-1]